MREAHRHVGYALLTFLDRARLSDAFVAPGVWTTTPYWRIGSHRVRLGYGRVIHIILPRYDLLAGACGVEDTARGYGVLVYR